MPPRGRGRPRRREVREEPVAEPPPMTTPSIKVTVPKAFNLGKHVVMKVLPQEFNGTWLEMFRQKNPILFGKLRDRAEQYVVVDVRPPPERKEWKLNNQVSAFIDSFQRNRQQYRAELRRHPGTGASSGRAGRIHMSTNGVNANTNGSDNMAREERLVLTAVIGSSDPRPSTSRNAQLAANKVIADSNKTPPAQKRKVCYSNSTNQRPNKLPNSSDNEFNLRFNMPQNFRNINVPPPVHMEYEDDACSMAASQDSQDSQDDLIEAGVIIQDVKRDFLEKINKKVDNAMVLRMQHELQTLMTNDKWLRLVASIPFTSNVLRAVLNIRDN